MRLNNEPLPKPLYLPAGRLFRTSKRNHIFEILYKLGHGGQGTVFLVQNKDTGKKMTIKFVHGKFANGETIKRLEYQVSQRFHKISPIFLTPRDLVIQDGLVGYVADYAEGSPIDVIVEKREIDIIQALMACLMLAKGFRALHDLDVLHCDVRESNIRIAVLAADEGVEVSVIDWDGMSAPALPPTLCVGSYRYMAPELLSALKKDVTTVPTKATECYSLAGIFHEFITMRHHLTGYDQSPEVIHDVVCRGKWLYDIDSPFNPDYGGYPPAILNTRLVILFRRAFSLDPANRPTAREWENALLEALGSILLCPFCKAPTFVDHSKTICPYCNRPFPTLKAITSSGKHIVVNSPEVVIGRTDLGGDKTISRSHLILRKLGPEVFVQVVGKLVVSRKNGKGWEDLDFQKLIPIEPGQSLRIGNHKLQLVRCDMRGQEV